MEKEVQMALPQNRKAIVSILEEISPRIIGQRHGGFTCNCGAVHSDPGIVNEIEPAGDSYPGQEVLWFLWRVGVRHHPEDSTNRSGFSCGLSEFIPAEELVQIFEKHFGKDPKETYPYNLTFAGQERFHLGMKAAVCIKENDHQIRFSFDWGADQHIAHLLNKIEEKMTTRRSLNGSSVFEEIFNLLNTFSPSVYRGGPDPELPFESIWHLDYQTALAVARKANHVFLQCGGSFYDHRGSVQTNGDVVFMKYHLN